MDETLSLIRKDIRVYATPDRARVNAWFFKTGAGQYGEGDVFLGVTVPDVRRVAKCYERASFSTIKALLHSPYHEERLCGLLILVERTQKADEKTFAKMYAFYLAHRKRVNNWDLVDLSAHKIVGRYLYEYGKPRKLLYTYAQSKNLWERRIAVLSTFWFISKNDFTDSLAIAELLVHDTHDLIHQAVGWMLREVGKRDLCAEETFLRQHYSTMPRTMLRYAIEKFPEKKRKAYLEGSMSTTGCGTNSVTTW